ncbi:MAG: hypothetical protein D6741_19955 [Planctomycetota bacterium]|nr:MAG: hypothetical protein D6741_19955 [Planctomycetota bacterium]
MKQVLCVTALIAGLAILSGCSSHAIQHRQGGIGLTGLVHGSCAAAPETCQDCAAPAACPACQAGAPCALHGHRLAALPKHHGLHQQPMIDPGPPTAAVTYPYYTIRGPRDFLQSEPTPIGP